MVRLAVLLSLLALVLLASFTGYLVPPPLDAVSDETRNRFTILHMIALPSMIAILLAATFWIFRATRQPAAHRHISDDRAA